MKVTQGTVTDTESTEESVHKPDWMALRLLNQYRLLILLGLVCIYQLTEERHVLGAQYPWLFVGTHLAYFLTTLGFMYLSRVQRPSVNTQFFLQNYFDILFISLLMYSSGGVESGLGPLLLITIALLSQLASVRHSLMFAAIATIVVIGEELLGSVFNSSANTNLQSTALLGSLLFLTAWLTTVPLRRLLGRQLASSTKSRVVLDVRQIAQLNEEIIRELDSGVLVVDHAGNVQLMNDTARVLLAVEFVDMPVQLKKLSSDLHANMDDSAHTLTLKTSPFNVASTGNALLPQYTRLSSGGMLIRLDDHAYIRQQYQQLKLASLGRLSASIAHEIRNPLGAISHAVQLIEESDTLDAKDADLLRIAHKHTQRISRIIDDVLQLSNRERVRLEEIDIDQAIEQFAQRFSSENCCPEQTLHIKAEKCSAIVDAGHLDQVLWNLCTNAYLHNNKQPLNTTISCWYAGHGATIVDVYDNGKGVSDFDRDKLFEPFYSTHHAGTGLGLFIIRELCELNKANIECLASPDGAHFRVTLTNAQDMAA